MWTSIPLRLKSLEHMKEQTGREGRMLEEWETFKEPETVTIPFQMARDILRYLNNVNADRPLMDARYHERARRLTNELTSLLWPKGDE